MSVQKFSIPEIHIDLKAREQRRKKALEESSLSSEYGYISPQTSAIIFTVLSVTPLFACYGIASMPIFLLAVIVWIVGISAFWRHRNEVEKQDKIDLIPAEELTLDDVGFHWKRLNPINDGLDVGWDEFDIISFDPDDYYLKIKDKAKIKHPRIMLDEDICSQIIRFIEQNTKLVKTVENKQWRDEEYVAISFKGNGEGFSGVDSNTNALEKFKSEIDRTGLIRSAEYYYHQGESLMAKNEFDDAIAEFVKVIRISSPKDTWYLSAKKSLQEMGFSETDIQQTHDG